ncbi:MAG: hypothetical protein ACFCGT_27310 [Sandaracinaceae bacterium]
MRQRARVALITGALLVAATGAPSRPARAQPDAEAPRSPPDPGEEAATPPAPALPAEEGAPFDPVPPLVFLSVGAGLAALSPVFFVLAGNNAREVTRVPEGTPWLDVRGSYRRSQTFSIVGGVLLATGAFVAAGALSWLVYGALGVRHEDLEARGRPDVRVGLARVDLRVRF